MAQRVLCDDTNGRRVDVDISLDVDFVIFPALEYSPKSMKRLRTLAFYPTSIIRGEFSYQIDFPSNTLAFYPFD